MQLNTQLIKQILEESLKEDFGTNGDITSKATIPTKKNVEFTINTREEIIVCGTEIAKYYFDNYSSIKYDIHITDSNVAKKGSTLISGTGNAQEILLLERVILNFMQHLSGISTLTHKFVNKIKDTNATILDTRKTTPLLRYLQKHAVTCGGGKNHRLCLDSSIMIKDNHIAICGSIEKAIKLAKQNTPHYAKIEVECDNLDQVIQALNSKADIIMLDNMSLQDMSEAVKIADKNAILEASGNVSLDTVYDIAKTGVNYISVGKITHSAPAADIGLDIN